MKMDQHITLAAALRIGSGVLGVIIAIIVFVAVAGGGIISRDPEAIAITSLVGSIIAGVIIFFSIPDIIGGIALLKRKKWGRIMVIILACLDLIEIPIGTALGIYSLWVLLNEDTAQYFEDANKEDLPSAAK